MAAREDLEFTYSLIDRIFRLSLGELADFSGAKYDGDFSLSLEEAQRRKHSYVAEQIGIGPGRRIVEERVGVAVGHGLVVEPLFQQLRVEKDLRPVGRGGRALECERDRAAVRLERAREDLARSGATTLPLLPIPGGARALRSVRGGAGEPKRR
jgi:Mycolic acid cyclopropane synthetase